MQGNISVNNKSAGKECTGNNQYSQLHKKLLHFTNQLRQLKGKQQPKKDYNKYGKQ